MRQCGYCPKALLGRINLPSFDLRCRDPDPFARRMIAERAHDTQSHPTRRRLGVWIGLPSSACMSMGSTARTPSGSPLATGEGRFLVIRTERAGRPARILLMAGDHFLFVRNRPKDLPEADSLDALIAASRAFRAQIIGYLDTATEIMQHSDIMASYLLRGGGRCVSCRLRMLM